MVSMTTQRVLKRVTKASSQKFSFDGETGCYIIHHTRYNKKTFSVKADTTHKKTIKKKILERTQWTKSPKKQSEGVHFC